MGGHGMEKLLRAKEPQLKSLRKQINSGTTVVFIQLLWKQLKAWSKNESKSGEAASLKNKVCAPAAINASEKEKNKREQQYKGGVC